jgi:hypothetical protein
LEYLSDTLEPFGHEFLRQPIFGPTGDVNARLQSIDDVKWVCLGCAAHSVVVADYGKGQEAGPIVRFVVHVGAEILFQGSVDSLGLSIPLRVVGGTEFSCDA